MNRKTTLSTALVLLAATALAGCTGGDDAGTDDTGADLAAGDLNEATGAPLDPNLLTEESVVEAPVWKLGDWWGHHLYFGPDDTEGTHINTIAVEEQAGRILLASDNADVAKEHAVWDYPILGWADPGVQLTGFGSAWEIFDFPMSHGHTWRTQFTIPDFNSFDEYTYEVEFTATFNPEVDTLGGKLPGYDILGATVDGITLFEYDYVPEIRWYANFLMYDYTTEDPEDTIFLSRSMGNGDGWTGQYFISEANTLTEHFSGIAVDPEDPQNYYAAPAPHASFTVGEDASYIYGFILSIAVGGAHETLLVDPAQTPHAYTAVGAPFEQHFDFWDIDAVPGQWEVVTAGAGVVALGGVFLWEVVETSGTM
ncbi:MAG: hypothetical protein ACPGQL_10070 [Thermoplasmatota archaeon]